MTPTSLDIVRQVHQSLKNWLESVRKFPDPASQPSDLVDQIGQQLKLVDEAVRQAPPAVAQSQEWRDELTAYKETLREVRARLGNFEITLRIRQSQASKARNQIDAIRSWSDLAKNIG